MQAIDAGLHADMIRGLTEYVRQVDAADSTDSRFDGLRLLGDQVRLSQVLAGGWQKVIPVTVEVWPSLTCDARCPLCPYRRSGARSSADRTEELKLLNVETTSSIFADLARSGVRSIIFTGGGEPLLHPHIVDMAQAAVDAGLEWALFTNGTNLHSHISNQLLQLGPRFLRVSLDAASALEHHRVFRLGDSGWFKVLGNVRSAGQNARRHGSSAFGISLTVLPSISDEELERGADLAADLARDGLGFISFRPRLNHFAARPRLGSYTTLADRISSAFAHLPEHGVSVELKASLYREADRVSDGLEVLAPIYGTSFVTTITETADLYAVNELAGVDGRIGSLAEMEFMSLWQGTARKNTLDHLERGDLRLPALNRTSPIASFIEGLLHAVGTTTPKAASQVASIAGGLKLRNFNSHNVDFV